MPFKFLLIFSGNVGGWYFNILPYLKNVFLLPFCMNEKNCIVLIRGTSLVFLIVVLVRRWGVSATFSDPFLIHTNLIDVLLWISSFFFNLYANDSFSLSFVGEKEFLNPHLKLNILLVFFYTRSHYTHSLFQPQTMLKSDLIFGL